jgi:tRNA pseudouridine38-40 synthase
MQVVHFDTTIEREPFSWMRGTNRFLPDDIAVQWAHPVPDEFHCRASALARRYLYVLSQSPVRPSLDAGRVGWSMHALDGDAMRKGGRRCWSARMTSARSAPRPARPRSPVKNLRRIDITRVGEGERCRWHFEFEADAFLHHMIRNLMGCLVRIGRGDERRMDLRGAGSAQPQGGGADLLRGRPVLPGPVVRRQVGSAGRGHAAGRRGSV